MLVLGFNSLGLSFFYLVEIELCKIKSERYSTENKVTPENHIILFSSTTRGIHLVDKKEIFADGKLYDIVKIKIINGITLYYTESDDEEDGYVHALTNLERNNSGDKTFPGKNMKPYEAKYFAVEHAHCTACTILDRLQASLTANNFFLYPFLLKNIYSPPPDGQFT